uniref:Uncharacterized protein n=1 Tax=Dunaliella tertiolecta TaxID=3047 RepID=A0A7S3QKC0_DUNTE
MVKRKSQPSSNTAAVPDPAKSYGDAAKNCAQQAAQDAMNRDPDAFDVYINNDFHAYGCAEVAENLLNQVHAKCAADDYKQAFQVLEGFTKWCEKDQTFTTMDDGERCNALIKLLLSAWVHVARTGHAHIKDFVNFRFVLGKTVKLGKQLQDGDTVSNGPAALQALLDGAEVQTSDQKSSPDYYAFNTLFSDYVKLYGKSGKIGGDAFDLTKQDLEELRQQGSDEDEDEDGEGGGMAEMMLATFNQELSAQGRPLMTLDDVHGIIMRSLMAGGDDDDEDEEGEEGEEEDSEEGEEGEGDEEEEEEAEDSKEEGAAPAASKKARK